jgi:hypothetical protein
VRGGRLEPVDAPQLADRRQSGVLEVPLAGEGIAHQLLQQLPKGEVAQLGKHLRHAAGADAGDDEGQHQTAGRGEHQHPGGDEGAAPGLHLRHGMGEVEVAAGENQGGADAGDDEEGALGGRRDGLSIGAQDDEDQTGRLHQDGGQRDPETGAPGRHRSLRTTRVDPARLAAP